MSNEAKTEYLNSIREEYRKASRREKSAILTHAVFVTKLSRKRIIRLLSAKGAGASSPSVKRGRPRIYGEDLLVHVKTLWFLMEQPCGKKLEILIPRILERYRKRCPDLTDEQAEKLGEMKAATLDRLLKPIRSERRGACTTKAPSSSWYKTAIPVQPKDWNITEPGFAQADTVSHCGESASGAFASTLTLTDIDSHWTEMRATWTKQHQQIIRALRDIEKQLPFRLHTIKFDSGSEFMNYEVVSFCRQEGPSYRPKALQILRSRPYRKNDNCYVEQKNLTHVRQFVGYDRIQSERAARLLNELYREAWCPFLNFFMPTFKLIRKERVGSRIRKKHEAPKTPYERLMESAALSEEQKQALRDRYAQLDPFELKARIEEKLKLLLELIRKDQQEEQNQDELLKLTA